MRGRRTEGWPQKAQEGAKGADRRRGRGPEEAEFLTTKHMKDGNRRRSYFTEPSRSSGGRAQSSEDGVLAAKEHWERKEDGGANRSMGRRRTEGWPQKAQEGAKGGRELPTEYAENAECRRGRRAGFCRKMGEAEGAAETEFLTTKHSKDGNRRRSYFTEPSRSSGGRAQSSEGGVLAAKEHWERIEDGGANRGMGRRRTECWPQKAQEGTKGGDRRRGWSFLTMAERGSAEVVTLISVARNEVEGD
jgi:hypothetical protein